MRAIGFGALLKRAVWMSGLDYENLPRELAASFAAWLEGRVRLGWHRAQWPGTIAIEEHAFRPVFSLVQTYALGAEVYDPESGAYYLAIEDGFSGQPVLDDSFWAPLTGFVKSLALDEAGSPTIAEILGAWRIDPRRFAGAMPLDFWIGDGAAHFAAWAPATVWLKYRKAAPRFSTDAWDAGTSYAVGDVVSYQAGTAASECYVARVEHSGIAPTDADTWCVQRCPEALGDFAARGAYADFLRADGQTDKGAEQERVAEAWLADRLADLVVHQRQAVSYAVR